MFKVFLIVVAALAAALYFPTSRAYLADKAGPVVNPWLAKATRNELQKIGGEMRRLSRNNISRAPDRRALTAWIENNYAGDAAIDAWGSPYEMRETRREIILYSLGPDRTRGTADDIQVRFSRSGLR